jgi:hypothetical protein
MELREEGEGGRGSEEEEVRGGVFREGKEVEG